MQFLLRCFASVFQAVFLNTVTCYSGQVLQAVFLNTATCFSASCFSTRAFAFVSASRFSTRAVVRELCGWSRFYIARYIAYYIHMLSGCVLRSGSEEQSTEVRLSSPDSVLPIHVAYYIIQFIIHNSLSMAKFIANSVQLQFICIMVPRCLNSVACRIIIFLIRLHDWFSRFPKALLHYSLAAACPSLATRCLEEADISYGSHHYPCEVTGCDRYFTFQDTHSCSFSHSASSFSITCEMVALGPALHELRYGATCYFQLVFRFALLLCCTPWRSDCPTARRCTVKASVRMFCFMVFALSSMSVSADLMETNVVRSVSEQVQPLHITAVAKPFLISYVAAGFATTMLFMLVCHMHHGGGHHRQHDINDLHLQTASGKIPPSWSPERDRSYSFRQFQQDILLWAAATDVQADRQGPAVALRLAGSAKVLAREMDPNMLINGVMIDDPAGGYMLDPNNGQPMRDPNTGNYIPAQIAITGLEALMRQLRRRYAPLDQEIQISAISELFHFRRSHHEGTDELIARFDLCIHRAANMGQVVIGEPIKAWMLLSASGIGREKWAMLLQPTLGALPTTAAEFHAFQQYMRRQGHVFDHSGDKTVAQPFFSYFGGEQQEEQQDYNAQDWTAQPYNDAYSQQPAYWSGEEYAYVGYDADDDGSSGNSDDDEPVDLSEIQGMNTDQAGEVLYFAYRGAKRKFRRFTRQPGRKGRGKGRKGKGRGKGKGQHNSAFISDYPPTQYWQAPEQEQFAYKGFGKGSKGNGRRGNPIGPDGKVMKCTECGSEEHFRAKCPKGSGKGNGKPGKSAFPVQHVHWSQQPGVLPGDQPSSGYLALEPLLNDVSESAMFFPDGTVERFDELEAGLAVSTTKPVSRKPDPKPVPPHMRSLLQFPCWIADNAYHAAVRLEHGKEGLLVDVGAIKNMCGDKWALRVETQAKQAGQGSTWSTVNPITLEGVGSGTSIADQFVQLPICLTDSTPARYDAIVVRNSELPALLGLDSIEAQHGVIDTHNLRLIYPGKGGIQYNLSPGTRVIKLVKARSGHLLVPCCEWATAKASSSAPGKAHVFVVKPSE